MDDDETADPGESRDGSPDEGTPPEEDDGEQGSVDRQCENCGASLDRYSKFCTECGTEQEQTPGPEQRDSGGQQGGAARTGGERGPGQQGGTAGQRGPNGQSGGRGQQTPNSQSGGGQRGRGQQSGGQRGRGQQSGRRQQSGRGQRGRGQQSGRRQQSGRGQQPGRGGQPDRLQQAGPNSSTELAAITHILALFTGLLGPILLYAVTDDPFVKENAAKATNWQIMVLIYGFVSGLLILLVIGIFLFLALILVDLAFIIIATIKALNGEAWSYPLTPDLL